MNSNSINKKEIRKFGTIASVFFGILFAVGLWQNKALASYIFGCLFILSIGFILMPSQLRHVYSVWLKIATVIGSTVTALILTVVFYFVIVPTALAKYIFGGRPLPLKPDKNTSTYWVTRTEPAQPKERFLKRY